MSKEAVIEQIYNEQTREFEYFCKRFRCYCKYKSIACST